jgi:membrane-bound lytic murein transglycosylase D
MSLLTLRNIMLGWLASVLLGCAVPRLPSTTAGSADKKPIDHSPPAVDLPHARGDGPGEKKLADKEAPLSAGSPQRAKQKDQRKVEKTPEEQSTTVPEATAPAADDELLDLWRKEMDHAMEQPSGQRKIRFSSPVLSNQRVRYFVEGFRGSQRNFFERALARSAKYTPLMEAILREEGLPENLVYLALIESGFSPYAYSRAKAMGPWQFIRSTALRYGLKIDSWVDERRDPVLSTRAAAAYLKDLHELFGEWFLAAAAYNAGEGRVGRALERSRTNDYWDLTEQKKYLALETRNYVPKFIAAAIIADAPEEHGFEEVAYETPWQYDEVTIYTPLRLQTVAALAKTDVNAIKELNPALLRNFTPPDDDGFTLRLPLGSGETFSDAYKLLPASVKLKLNLHRVKKGERLSNIAKRYGQTVRRIMKENGLKSTRLRPGQELIIVREGAR